MYPYDLERRCLVKPEISGKRSVPPPNCGSANGNAIKSKDAVSMDLSVYRRFHDEAHNWILKSASCSARHSNDVHKDVHKVSISCMKFGGPSCGCVPLLRLTLEIKRFQRLIFSRRRRPCAAFGLARARTVSGVFLNYCTS
jgi:hypothetical protein